MRTYGCVAGQRGAFARVFSQCDPYDRWLFADRESALKHAPRADADFVASHEAMLGHSIGRARGGRDCLSNSTPPSHGRFPAPGGEGGRQSARTFSAHLGDPGFPHLTISSTSKARIAGGFTSSEAHYRSASPAAMYRGIAVRGQSAIEHESGHGDGPRSPRVAPTVLSRDCTRRTSSIGAVLVADSSGTHFFGHPHR
jgi:hypothetical protein